MDKEKQHRISLRSFECGNTILQALQKMDQLDGKLLMVTQAGSYAGLLSIGDIQRAIIANHSLDTPVEDILRSDIRVAHVDDGFDSIQAMMLQFRTEFMPVLDNDRKLVDVYFWDDVFLEKPPSRKQIRLPVIIMAGGKGARLKPFSNILPKPLFPVGEKTISETIIERFHEAGCRQFLMSVNYKADFIEAYFNQPELAPLAIEFFRETKPLGTAGSLHLVRDRIQETFVVSNCDIIVDTDYSEILDYHRDHQNEITLVAALQHMTIPYGTLQTAEGGKLLSIQEKPELTHLINAGMYLLEPHLLQEIPQDTFFHITDLIDQVLARNGRVGVFPVSEKSWSDIGEWEKYNQTLLSFSPGRS